MTDVPRLHESSPPDHRAHGIRQGAKVDLTINIPTIITIISMAVGAVMFGVGAYNDLNGRTSNNSKDIVSLKEDVADLKSGQGAFANEMRRGLETLRTENREDFREVRASIDNLGAVTRSSDTTKGWTK